VWSFTGIVVTADALVSTPIGLSFLLVLPLSIAAFMFQRREIALLTLVCITARLLFGPVGDPLALRGVAFEVSATTQLWVSAAFSIVTYVAVALIFHRLAAQQRSIRDLRGQAERDALTGTANRRALESFLRDHEDEEGSMIVIDVDHFKSVNDTYGHDAGDRVLRTVGQILHATTRKNDLVARIGGEEFVLVLATAPLAAAERIAERILQDIRSGAFDIGTETPLVVTASAGCAAGPLNSELLKLADNALYEAKRSGRDQVVTAPGVKSADAEASH
jgi:diguanylate cyclase (GGDEF)-like protein